MAFFPNQNRDPFPRNLMVPGRAQPVSAQARGFGTGRYGAQGGNPALKSGVKPYTGPQLGGRPNPNGITLPWRPGTIPGGSPGPVKGGGGVNDGGQAGAPNPGGAGTYWGANPNQIMDMLAALNQHNGQTPPIVGGGPAGGTKRNPLEHLNWWLQHGWRYNEGKDRFSRVPNAPYTGPQLDGRPNPQGGGGQVIPGGGGPGPVIGGNGQNQNPGNGNGAGDGGMFDTTTGALNPGAVRDLRKQFGLPLDPQFEAERRQMVQALNSQLAQIMAQRGNVEGQYGLDTARMATQQGLDNRSLVDQMAARGVVGSGVQNRAQGLQDASYARAGQDLGFNKASQLGDLASAQSGLQSQFTSGLMEAIMDLIRRQSATGGRAPKGKG